MSLVDDLKAAHEAATPGPWVADCNEYGDGYVARYQEPTFQYMLGKWPYHDPVVNPVKDAELIVLTRNALPGIIAVLEAAVDIGCEDWDYRVGRLGTDVLPDGGRITDERCNSCASCRLAAALAALEGKG